MKRQATLVVAGLLLMAAPAAAVPEHDTSVERAAMDIVADKIGPLEEVLRGTFGRDETPEFSTAIVRVRPMQELKPESVWADGLAPAVDPVRAVHRQVADRAVVTGDAR